MSDATAGTVIDGLEFARSGGVFERSLELRRLSRLTDVLSDAGGVLAVRLDGRRDAEGKSWLALEVTGEPVLVCQRCLGGMSFPLKVRSRLQLIAPGQEWPDDDLADDGADAIDAGAPLDVAALVEDEVLLALPIAPRHERCEPPRADAADQGSSPFSALAAMKMQRNKE